MSRGVVLWPDRGTGDVIRGIWDDLCAAGLPSQASFTHRLHQPHCSLIVGESLDTAGTLAAIDRVPSAPIPLQIEAAIVFGGGVLAVGCVLNGSLAAEQRRIHDATAPFVSGEWPYFSPGRWTPHITLSMELKTHQLSQALSIVLPHLPIKGTFDHGGIEDGTTGQNWSTFHDSD